MDDNSHAWRCDSFSVCVFRGPCGRDGGGAIGAEEGSLLLRVYGWGLWTRALWVQILP